MKREVVVVGVSSLSVYLYSISGPYLSDSDTPTYVSVLYYVGLLAVAFVFSSLLVQSAHTVASIILLTVFGGLFPFFESASVLLFVDEGILGKYDYLRRLSLPITLPTAVFLTVLSVLVDWPFRRETTGRQHRVGVWLLVGVVISGILSSNTFTRVVLTSDENINLFWRLSEDTYRYGLFPMLILAVVCYFGVRLFEYSRERTKRQLRCKSGDAISN